MEKQTQAIEKQTQAIKGGFTQLGRQVEDLANTISWSMKSVADAIDSLERTMSWGLAQVIWQQEQTNQLLQDILKRLSSPRTTEAEELQEQSNEFFKNGVNSKRPEDRERWMNLAIEAYLESICKNPADFSVFHSLGVILFFETLRKETQIWRFGVFVKRLFWQSLIRPTIQQCRGFILVMSIATEVSLRRRTKQQQKPFGYNPNGWRCIISTPSIAL